MSIIFVDFKSTFNLSKSSAYLKLKHLWFQFIDFALDLDWFKAFLTLFNVLFFQCILQWVGSIDLNANDQADANIIVDKEAGWVDQETAILSQLQGLLDSNQLDAVICVAGKIFAGTLNWSW